MARQRNIKLSVTTGGLIFYQRLGGAYIRKKPVNNKQTAATKRAGLNFGKANRIEKQLRTALLPVIPDAKDKNMMRRFAAAIYRWLNSSLPDGTSHSDPAGFITGFEFNKYCTLTERMHIALTTSHTTDNELVLQVPSFRPAEAIVAPAHTQNIIFTIAAASCDVATMQVSKNFTQQFSLAFTNQTIPAREFMTGIICSPGCLDVVAISLQYFTGNSSYPKPVKRREWLPAGIVQATFY